MRGDAVVDGAIEGVGLRRPRRMRVLDEVGEREIEQRRRLALQQRAGRRPARRARDRRSTGRASARPTMASTSPMPLAAWRRAVGMLGGEVDALEAARQHQPQLVLGRDGGGLDAGIRHGGQDGAAAHQRGVGDHALLAGGAVEVVVAGDAVHGRRHAGDDRGVVGVGEARHDGVGDGVEAAAPGTRRWSAGCRRQCRGAMYSGSQPSKQITTVGRSGVR